MMDYSSHQDLGIQKQTLLCSTGTTVTKPQRVDQGVQHSFTCWPKDLYIDDQSAFFKWIKRTERNDAYLQTVLSAGQRAEALLLENVCLEREYKTSP